MASIRKRTWTSSGRERSAWVVDYVDAAGKRRLKTFATKKAADAWSVQARHQVAAGTHTPDRASVTVAAAGDAWLRRCEAERLEPHTLRHYRSHLAHHIVPALGAVTLARLTAPRIARFAETMLRDHSRATTRKVLTSLRAVLNLAMVQGLVAQNVAHAVKVGSRGRHTEKVKVPTPDEIRLLLARVSDRWRPFLLTAVLTGLRASELRGLCWADVDLQAARMTVAQRADERGVIGSPKSASSRRALPLPPVVVAALREWRDRCPPGALDLVFPNKLGRPQSLGNIANRFWGPLQVDCRVVELRTDRTGAMVPHPRYGLHALRHFYVSWLINQGFPPKRVQALLGHASIKLTLDTYGHLWPDEADDAARLAAAEKALLSPANALDATRMRQDQLSA